MSDEAFARRFYSDRASCSPSASRCSRSATSSPARSSTPSAPSTTSCRRSSSTTTSSPRSRPCLYLLEGSSRTPSRSASRCRTSRSAGRASPSRRPTTAVRVEVFDPDYSAEMPGRLGEARGGDLEAADGQVPVLVDLARRAGRADCQPLRALSDNGVWYLVGQRPRARRRSGRSASRAIRGDITLRDAARARLPDPGRFRRRRATAARPPWQIGETVGEARIEVAPDTAWWVERAFGDRGRSRTASSSPTTRRSSQLASWILRQDGRAMPLEPAELVTRGRTRRSRGARAPRGRRRRSREAEARRRSDGTEIERPAGPVAPERFARPAGAARLPARRLRRRAQRASIPADELVERFRIPEESARGAPAAAQPRQLRRRLLRGLRRARRRRGARSTRSSSATRSGSPPRLTPLEARAIRLALEFVGPMIAADAHTPLDRVREKLEETFGAVRALADARAGGRPGRGGARLRP